MWTIWRGTRGTKADPIEGEHHLFGFLTTAPSSRFRMRRRSGYSGRCPMMRNVREIEAE
jgi:hypothetical protein